MSAVVPATPTSPAVSSPTVGPRPLQLLETNLSNSPVSPNVLSPRTSSSLGLSTPPPSARSFKAPNPRRQSSISYFPSDHVDLRSPTTSSRDRTAARRTNSMGIWTTEGVAGRAKGDRRSLGSLTRDTAPPMSPGPSVDHGPLTLTEKHADLLQFIAQKESKCLELRSQLATQEAELAELKRKWERIVSRGMDRAYSSPLTPSRSPNTAATMTPSSGMSSLIPSANAALKEGVRLLAAGLDLSASEPSSPPAFSPPAVPISGIATVSRATMASTAALKKSHAKHAAKQSMSSVSTATTSSTSTQSQRLSQSSASSLMTSLSLEDPVEEELTKILPSVIPEGKVEVLAEAVELSPRSPNSSLRRRSRDSGDSRPSALPSAQVTKQPLPKAPLSAPMSPDAGWMGSMGNSVGKKWEELQRGDTFTKSQKRASLLLSDVSQSIFAALASPSPKQSSTFPALGKPSPLSTVPSSSSASLLDDEPDFGSEQGLGAVLIPSVLPSSPAPPPAQAADEQDDDEDWNW